MVEVNVRRHTRMYTVIYIYIYIHTGSHRGAEGGVVDSEERVAQAGGERQLYTYADLGQAPTWAQDWRKRFRGQARRA